MLQDPTSGVGFAFGAKWPSTTATTICTQQPRALDIINGGSYANTGALSLTYGAALTLAFNAALAATYSAGVTATLESDVGIGTSGGVRTITLDTCKLQADRLFVDGELALGHADYTADSDHTIPNNIRTARFDVTTTAYRDIYLSAPTTYTSEGGHILIVKVTDSGVAGKGLKFRDSGNGDSLVAQANAPINHGGAVFINDGSLWFCPLVYDSSQWVVSA